MSVVSGLVGPPHAAQDVLIYFYFLFLTFRFGRLCFLKGARGLEKPALSLRWLQQQDMRCNFFFRYFCVAPVGA